MLQWWVGRVGVTAQLRRLPSRASPGKRRDTGVCAASRDLTTPPPRGAGTRELVSGVGGVPEGEYGNSPGKWHRKGDEGWEMSGGITSVPEGRAFIEPTGPQL